MKKLITGICAAFLLFQNGFAKEESITGLFFDVTNSGPQVTITTRVPNHPDPYPRASIQVMSTEYRLSDPLTECTSYDSTTGVCIFTASNTVPKSFTISGPAGTAPLKLCLNGVGTLTCQHYFHSASARFPTQIIYVVPSSQNAQDQGYITSCPLLNNGATIGTDCIQSASSNLVSPQGITINPTKDMVYIPNFGNGTVTNCSIVNYTTGELGSCVSNGGTFEFGHRLIGNVGVTTDYVYVAVNADNKIWACPIQAGGTLGACVDMNYNGQSMPAGPSSITINGSLMYIAVPGSLTGSTYAGTAVVVCTFTGSTFGSCINSGQTFSGPLSVSFNSTSSSGLIAYVANGNNSTVSQCTVNLGTGAFSSCSVSGQPFNFGTASEGPVTNIFMMSPLAYGYVPNAANDNVSICPLNGATGALGTCTTTGSTSSPYFFLTPTGVAVLG